MYSNSGWPTTARLLNSPVQFSETPARITSVAPQLGAHKMLNRVRLWAGNRHFTHKLRQVFMAQHVKNSMRLTVMIPIVLYIAKKHGTDTFESWLTLIY